MPKKKEKEPDRVLLPGKPDFERCDNKVVSARYTIYNFLPVVRGCILFRVVRLLDEGEKDALSAVSKDYLSREKSLTSP